MGNPTISVITICYNAENEIEHTMRSVLNQTYTNLEYIIVDGASKDGTISVVNRIVKEYPERDIKVISEPDKGIYDAMNKGIRIAKGEWLNMMNAGDVFADNNVLSNVLNREIPLGKEFLYSNAWLEFEGERFLSITSVQKGIVLHQASIYRKGLHKSYGEYLVTKPIIISDYLFFCHVPEEKYLKIEDTVIAVFEQGGVSSQNWCLKQKLCADVIFNKRTFANAIWLYLINSIKRSLPLRTRKSVMRYLRKIKCPYWK